jgi:hypothetical protein
MKRAAKRGLSIGLRGSTHFSRIISVANCSLAVNATRLNRVGTSLLTNGRPTASQFSSLSFGATTTRQAVGRTDMSSQIVKGSSRRFNSIAVEVARPILVAGTVRLGPLMVELLGDEEEDDDGRGT